MLVPAQPTGLYSHVAPLNTTTVEIFNNSKNI